MADNPLWLTNEIHLPGNPDDEDPAYSPLYDDSDEDSELEALFSVTGEQIVSTAMNYLGRPYRTGMAGPRAFDCSGFTSFVYSSLNITLERSSRVQYQQGISVTRDELQKGDLVFFGGSRGGKTVGHVGICVSADGNGNFQFIHASRSGIKIDDYNQSNYYHRRYIGARRIL